MALNLHTCPSTATSPKIGFIIGNSIYCKKVGLVTSLHNKLLDGVDNLTIKSLTTTYLRNNPIINLGRYVKNGKTFLDK